MTNDQKKGPTTPTDLLHSDMEEVRKKIAALIVQVKKDGNVFFFSFFIQQKFPFVSLLLRVLHNGLKFGKRVCCVVGT